MNRKLLATAICAAIGGLSTVAFAQDAGTPADTPQATDQATTDQQDDSTNLDKIVVTGSRIPRAQLETASPVLTITSEEIKAQGFRNVSDVLRAQPLSTGSVQDNQYAGFTSNATTISLLGLSPSFTLILLDGRPLADYPLL
jgi:outer membrane receptor for ferrienterochelin and colicin